MSKPAELGRLISGDETGRKVAHLWNRWNTQRRAIINEWKEQKGYIFATSSEKTSQGESTPWKNSTTLPKLTQIRDNLHSNYLSALFPNDEWLKWEAYTKADSERSKQEYIEAYMGNKVRNGSFEKVMSQLLMDYIDYGNAFATVYFEARYRDAEKTIPAYIGPRLQRISPEAIVFNPTAETFGDSAKIIRTMRNIGELRAMSEDQPDNAWLKEALADRDALQQSLFRGAYTLEDSDMAEPFQIQGFGNLQEYYMSDMVEVLEFHGDWHDATLGKLNRNQVITVIDRARVIREEERPEWLGEPPIYHVGWRVRTDNLWGMGPLNNLVGMQYRIDHLENSKADAYDLAIHPPLVIRGDVDDFAWGPGCELRLEADGDVQELGRNVQWVLQAQNEIAQLEARMEQYAGAPREAMGVRSPGEKTAFEVQALENAAGRIFQEKITTFERELLEPILNAMLETSRRNLDVNDVIRSTDQDVGVQKFVTITRDDITARGKLRPIGARHFAAQAQLLQNLNGVLGGPMGQTIAPHVSSKALAKLVEDTLGLERHQLFKPNQAIFEQQETQRLLQGAQEDLVAEAGVEEDIS
jgi:hypothetical protein